MEANYIPIKLPSNCKVYKDVDPSKLAIRTFKGKDEKLISELSYDNFEKKFVQVLKNVLRGIEPEKLTIGDRLFLMVWEVINSYGSKTPVEIVCSTCFRTVPIDVDLSALGVIELPDNFEEPRMIKLSSGKEAGIRLLRVEDQVKIEEYEKSGKGSHLYRIAMSLTGDGTVWHKMEMLEDLPVKDIALLRAFHEKYFHGPDMGVEYTCPQCGELGRVVLPFRLEFLFPLGEALTRLAGDAV